MAKFTENTKISQQLMARSNGQWLDLQRKYENFVVAYGQIKWPMAKFTE